MEIKNNLELVRVSSRGQLVLPKDTRSDLKIETGSVLAVFSNPKKKIVVLKKVEMPKQENVFEELHKWGIDFAEKQGLSKGDLKNAMRKVRGHV